MDKNTLSNYGWVVICVLVLVVMMALATPFGKYVATAVQNTTTALTSTADKQSENAGNIVNIKKPVFLFNGEKEIEMNTAGFFFDETYSIYSGGLGPDSPLPEGVNSFIFKKDGTVDHYINNVFVQTLDYVADEDGFGIPALGGTTTSSTDGDSIYIPEYDKILLKGSGTKQEGDITYGWNGYDWVDISYIYTGEISFSAEAPLFW